MGTIGMKRSNRLYVLLVGFLILFPITTLVLVTARWINKTNERLEFVHRLQTHVKWIEVYEYKLSYSYMYGSTLISSYKYFDTEAEMYNYICDNEIKNPEMKKDVGYVPTFVEAPKP